MDEAQTGTRQPSAGQLLARARARWPRVSVSEEELAAALDRASAGGKAAAHAEDLFLAIALARREPAALQAFEESVLPQARAALKARRMRDEAVEEALQQLRERLFVFGHIADYSGRGPLASWTRMAAVRLALNLSRGKAAQADEAGLDELVAPGIAPELALLKARHRPEFKSCFEQAFQALDDRARTALRLSLLEGLTTTQLARMFRVDGSTVRRWLAEARQQLLAKTRELLRDRLGLEQSELDSLIGLLLTQLDDSVRRILGASSR